MNTKVLYPNWLPILEAREEIVNAIKSHQVIIVSGETGSGKSTQLPKMCLEAGRGLKGRIGSTQPRRIAAITIAKRIAEEAGEPIGQSVGYKIRFTDKVSSKTFVKIMTDGILLAETQKDPKLSEYDTLIIDEAHERSLNIDLILGLLKRLLPLRPDLKVIVSSATMETEKFSAFFWDAPVIRVGGRLFPVAVEYWPGDSELIGTDEITYVDMALEAMDSLWHKGMEGDLLIFMPTEQDVLDTCRRIRGRRYDGLHVLPLFARLPAREQQKVYRIKGLKVVVATNVAETSLTIPGIRYVIDTGLARIPRYVARTRVTTMPISPISRASADQRKGRCGRVEEGLCIRLYSEKDFLMREEFTPPEVLRANLAGVILRLLFLGLGDIGSFPFLDPPPTRSIKDGFATLEELGAIERKGDRIELSRAGRIMARMPLDPRVARMLIEARETGTTKEICVIASALSIQDPREVPAGDVRESALPGEAFKDPRSDFMTILNIWEGLREYCKGHYSPSRVKGFCRRHSLSYLRIREWLDVNRQLNEILGQYLSFRNRRPKPSFPKDTPLYDRIHRAVLSGFLSNIAVRKEKKNYMGVKGKELMIFPASALHGKAPEWIVAAEMVKTSRLFARTVASIDPKWAEELGQHLCNITYLNPRWDKNRGQVVATAQVSLFGLVLSCDKTVSYGKINPRKAHEIFISHALVRGDIDPTPPFLSYNLSLVKKVRDMEERLRRPLLVAEQEMARFYSERLQGVYNVYGLKEAIKKNGGDEFLRMSISDLMAQEPEGEELKQYPEETALGPFKVAIRYKFSPGDPRDGVTLCVPFSAAPQVPVWEVDRAVPGLARKRIEAMVRGLPGKYRKLLVPLPEKISQLTDEILKGAEGGPLASRLAQIICQKFGVEIPASVLASVEVPEYLHPRIALVDERGREIKTGRDPSVLSQGDKIPFEGPLKEKWEAARNKWERFDLKRWDFGDLPDRVEVADGIVAIPILEDSETQVNLRLFLDPKKAPTSHKEGVSALYCKVFSKELKFVRRTLKLSIDLERLSGYLGGREALVGSIIETAIYRLFRKDIRRAREFEEWGKVALSRLSSTAKALSSHAEAILKAYHDVRSKLYAMESNGGPGGEVVSTFCARIRKELDRLVPRDFLKAYEQKRLIHIPRYLKALAIRIDRAQYHLEKDRRKDLQVKEFHDTLEEMKKGLSGASPERQKAIEEFAWALEEYKVAVFAPELKTAQKVSPPILREMIAQIQRMV